MNFYISIPIIVLAGIFWAQWNYEKKTGDGTLKGFFQHIIDKFKF